MFLGVTASVSSWDVDGTCCSIILEDNPLVDFVELPDTCQGLYYCNVLSGVIRGALEMVSFLSFFPYFTLYWLQNLRFQASQTNCFLKNVKRNFSQLPSLSSAELGLDSVFMFFFFVWKMFRSQWRRKWRGRVMCFEGMMLMSCRWSYWSKSLKSILTRMMNKCHSLGFFPSFHKEN